MDVNVNSLLSYHATKLKDEKTQSQGPTHEVPCVIILFPHPPQLPGHSLLYSRTREILPQQFPVSLVPAS